MNRYPSPCVDVCKYKREGHCIACSMTKEQKKLSEKFRSEKQYLSFLEMLRRQQVDLGGYDQWEKIYARKCARRGRAFKTV